jgi:hypothetical protein
MRLLHNNAGVRIFCNSEPRVCGSVALETSSGVHCIALTWTIFWPTILSDSVLSDRVFLRFRR